jgi:hypothetical protein
MSKTSKIDTEVGIKWVEALRSGKYKQGKHQLVFDGSYCCLGVLCEISGLEWPGNSALLPQNVQDWAGLDSYNGKYVSFGIQRFLSRDNDSGSTFEEIANTIEKEFLN